MTDSDRLSMYQRAVNKIDDYFEYRNESERDRARVHEILAELTAELQGEPNAD